MREYIDGDFPYFVGNKVKQIAEKAVDMVKATASRPARAA